MKVAPAVVIGLCFLSGCSALDNIAPHLRHGGKGRPPGSGGATGGKAGGKQGAQAVDQLPAPHIPPLPNFSGAILEDITHAVDNEVHSSAMKIGKQRHGFFTAEDKAKVREWVNATACLYLEKAIEGEQPTQEEVNNHFLKLLLKHNKVYMTSIEFKEKGESISALLQKYVAGEDKKKLAFAAAVKTYCELQ